MGFLAGDLITAARLNRLKPTPYWKAATGTLAASQTNQDIPGATITFNTETDLAEVQCWWNVDPDLSGASTSLGSSRLLLDNITPSDVFTTYVAEVATDRATVGQSFKFTIPTAGSHTIKIQGTTPANYTYNLYCSLSLLVHEVV
jgi:hypothetical protein